jgi:hypothetical protein
VIGRFVQLSPYAPRAWVERRSFPAYSQVVP